jgi:hypothetical protein
MVGGFGLSTVYQRTAIDILILSFLLSITGDLSARVERIL